MARGGPSAAVARYLAGAFGAERKADTPTAKPGQDGGSVHEAVVTSNAHLDATDTPPNAFKLDTGNLFATMNKTARYRADSTTRIGTAPNQQTVYRTTETPSGLTVVVVNSADDTLLVDTDAATTGNQFPAEDLKLSLATTVANARAEQNVNGRRKQREIFVAALETLRADLVLLRAWTRGSPLPSRPCGPRCGKRPCASSAMFRRSCPVPATRTTRWA